jgi:predicted HTH transcriptional regulator
VTLSILGIALLLSYLLVLKYGRQLKDRPSHALDEGKLDDSIRALIDQGESENLEFKSTMRMNLKSGKFGKEVEFAWLKTVVAFLNTNGGTLLIGVDDNGIIQGLDADDFENDDKCRLHFKNLISQHIGLEFSEFIEFDLKSTEGKTIGVVHCSRANAPVFLKHGRDEDFFIRSGPASLKLSVSQVLKYLKQR